MATERQESKSDKLALGVARGLSLRRSAADAGIPCTTARRHVVKPEFKARVAELRQAMIGCAVGRLANSAAKAAKVMNDLLGPSHEPELRLKAARGILSDLLNVQSHAELSDRLEALEAKIADKVATNGKP